jgi:diadenosine tetraphosphate (Ap4A) HIT family hydrolase
LDTRERKRRGSGMNPTIEKFGYPGTRLCEFDHWVVLLRPAQVTLGSLVLAAKGDAAAYSSLPDEAFTEQATAIRAIEAALAAFSRYERINYLMLMMVDPNVHFHVIPRYSSARIWNSMKFPDSGWPGPPQLGSAVTLSSDQVREMVRDLGTNFR